MDKGTILTMITGTLALSGGGCDYARDSVAAGFYGVMAGAGAVATTRPASGAQADADGPYRQGASAAGSGGMAAVGGVAGATGAAASLPSAGALAAGSAGGPTTLAANSCEMTGRWLVTLHTVTDALGQLQYAHSYLYYEISQQNDAFTISKGLHCGDDAQGDEGFAVSADFSGSWAAVASRVSYAGRKGTSTQSAGGCQVQLERWYEVKGATLPYYLDPLLPLPAAEQPASGDTPGWEDWDMDGNPGITGLLSGAVTGKVFTAPRRWTSASGVADISSVFTLPLEWDGEPNVMAYDGSPLLATTAARAADATLHFVQFARLTPEQASGDDAAICASIMQLAPTLTPEAAGN